MEDANVLKLFDHFTDAYSLISLKYCLKQSLKKGDHRNYCLDQITDEIDLYLREDVINQAMEQPISQDEYFENNSTVLSPESLPSFLKSGSAELNKLSSPETVDEAIENISRKLPEGGKIFKTMTPHFDDKSKRGVPVDGVRDCNFLCVTA